MQKYKKVLKVISKLLITILYYLLSICFPLFNPYVITIAYYSDILLIVFLCTPIILMLTPFILRKILCIDKFVSIIYSLFIAMGFFILMIVIGYFTKNYFENFSYEKWNNSNYCNMRYKMIESLEEKYSFVGMNRKDIYNILGKINRRTCMYDYEEDNKMCYMTYEAMMRNDFYCLYLDENDIVVDVKYESVR